MATFNGRPVIDMPNSPAPKSVEFTRMNAVAVSTSPFTFQQQVQDWNAATMEMSVSLPPMIHDVAAAWVDFLIACNGQANVFQLSNTKWQSLIPATAQLTDYWCLKSNSNKWSISEAIIYGLHFEV